MQALLGIHRPELWLFGHHHFWFTKQVDFTIFQCVQIESCILLEIKEDNKIRLKKLTKIFLELKDNCIHNNKKDKCNQCLLEHDNFLIKEIVQIHEQRTGNINTIGSIENALKELWPDIKSKI